MRRCTDHISMNPDSLDYASDYADSRSVVRLSVGRISVEISRPYTFFLKMPRKCTRGYTKTKRCTDHISTYPNSFSYAFNHADSRSVICLSVERILVEILRPYTFSQVYPRCTKTEKCTNRISTYPDGSDCAFYHADPRSIIHLCMGWILIEI